MGIEKRIRMTRQRRIILEELRKLHSHPTADEVYDVVRKRMPRISLGTVYRNLEVLSQWGQVQKLEMAGTPKRFDGSTEDHYHVRCLYCGQVEDIHVKPFRNLETPIRAKSGFEIIGHHLNFVGLCPTCKAEPHDALHQTRRQETLHADVLRKK